MDQYSQSSCSTPIVQAKMRVDRHPTLQQDPGSPADLPTEKHPSDLQLDRSPSGMCFSIAPQSESGSDLANISSVVSQSVSTVKFGQLNRSVKTVFLE
jgi:hypothetical protein